MIIHRNNGNANRPASTPEERLAVMQRHHERAKARTVPAVASAAAPPPSPPPPAAALRPPALHLPGPGDIVYGARAIALYLFGDDSNRARRRVFSLWAHYSQTKEPVGFFKLKGALCLAKSRWQKFHGHE